VEQLPVEHAVSIELLLASRIHRYDGRPADGPDPAVGPELFDEIEIRAGLGVVGDRFFAAEAHKRYSVTVMAAESLDRIAEELGLDETPDAAVTRRNIILRGIDIDSMRGQVFSLDSGDGPVTFRANFPANPCAWMNVMIAPGAHKALRGHGGMRCEPLSSGRLRLGPATLRVL
jgi:hypothetical protein